VILAWQVGIMNLKATTWVFTIMEGSNLEGTKLLTIWPNIVYQDQL
jgi:hypothetical protein